GLARPRLEPREPRHRGGPGDGQVEAGDSSHGRGYHHALPASAPAVRSVVREPRAPGRRGWRWRLVGRRRCGRWWGRRRRWRWRWRGRWRRRRRRALWRSAPGRRAEASAGAQVAAAWAAENGEGRQARPPRGESLGRQDDPERL